MRAALVGLALLTACLPDLRAAPPDAGRVPYHPDPCPSGRVYCREGCVDLMSDPLNCGGCGGACPSDALVCTLGRCVCPGALAMYCDLHCVDLLTDRRHCGACGRACPATSSGCVDGECRCDAAAGVSCNGDCVDFATDRANCGVCGRTCLSEAVCVAGACECPAGRHDACPNGCVDLAADGANCGACGRRCPTGTTCVAGACACPGAAGALCGDHCVDLATDGAHCGACGRACTEASRCTAGACLGRPRTPATGDRLGTRTPTFRWTEGDAAVDVCADRACARVVASLAGTAERGATATRLAPGVYFWRVRAPGSAPTAGAQGVPFRLDGRDAPTAGLLPPAPDLNGDGLADVVVLSGAGTVSVYLGARGALAGDASRRFEDASLGGGLALYVAGDVEGDGFGDVAVGGTSFRLVSGAASAEAMALLAPFITTPRAPLLDVNDDGRADWFDATAAGPGIRYGTGATSMSTGMFAPFSVSRAITTAAPVGDVNGDGRPDVALGAPGVAPPAAWVGLGGSAGVDSFLRLPPAPRTAGFAASVATAGDVNGDGFADVLVALGASGAAVYLGGRDALTLHRTLDGPADADLLVVAAGDVDGDGFGDVLAVPRARGEAWLYRGGVAGLAATPLVLRDARWALVDYVGVPGDVDGDGFDDVVAGAPSGDAVHVFHGAAVGALARVETLHGARGSDFGAGVL